MSEASSVDSSHSSSSYNSDNACPFEQNVRIQTSPQTSWHTPPPSTQPVHDIEATFGGHYQPVSRDLLPNPEIQDAIRCVSEVEDAYLARKERLKRLETTPREELINMILDLEGQVIMERNRVKALLKRFDDSQKFEPSLKRPRRQDSSNSLLASTPYSMPPTPPNTTNPNYLPHPGRQFFSSAPPPTSLPPPPYSNASAMSHSQCQLPPSSSSYAMPGNFYPAPYPPSHMGNFPPIAYNSHPVPFCP